ncbi:MAG: porin family protein [Bacteroidales bacterium]|nr:porin family protein [Bacteroidales bacterium]MCM1147239.1 porin family protein [Bacteroidales bacterium]MCM1207206.1 porin family protein [Bacillota bacterium]MCM1509730.1 porin family protein [Clostridium sp.]
MRKFIVIAIVMLAFAASSQAKIKFGLRGGVNITNMSLSNSVLDASNRTGFYVGPTVKIGLPLGFDIDASAVYDQRKGKITDIEDNESVSMTSKSIAIPLNLRKGFGFGDKASVFVFAGPQFAFRVGEEKFADWTMKSSLFSVNVGVGAMLLNHLEVKANYNIPCGKTAEAGIDDAVGNVKAGAWQIGVAVYF